MAEKIKLEVVKWLTGVSCETCGKEKAKFDDRTLRCVNQKCIDWRRDPHEKRNKDVGLDENLYVSKTNAISSGG